MTEKTIRIFPALWRGLSTCSTASPATCARHLASPPGGLLSSYNLQLCRTASGLANGAPRGIPNACRGLEAKASVPGSVAASKQDVARGRTAAHSSSLPGPAATGDNPGSLPPSTPSRGPEGPAPSQSLWAKTKPTILKNFLPLAFATALVAALVWPDPGRFFVGLTVLDNVRVAQVIPMALVFLITGLQLDTKDMRRALSYRNAPAVLYGLAAILLVTPCLGFLLRELPLEPKEFATGLAVFCVAPTTLGVGVALTTSCRGNEALALLLTVATNALAVFTMPPELQLLLPPGADGAAGAVNVNVYDLLTKLAATVLVPFAIGKTAREFWPAAQTFAKSARTPLSLFSTSCLAFVVWQTLSSARDLLLAQAPGPLLTMVGLALGMHVTYLAANYLVVWHLLRTPLREAIAVVIMASQKSAPVAVTVISYLSTNPAQQGLLALPAVVGQLGQIFIGAAMAPYLARLVARHSEAEALSAQQAQQAQQAAGKPSGEEPLEPPVGSTGSPVPPSAAGKASGSHLDRTAPPQAPPAPSQIGGKKDA